MDTEKKIHKAKESTQRDEKKMTDRSKKKIIIKDKKKMQTKIFRNVSFI